MAFRRLIQTAALAAFLALLAAAAATWTGGGPLDLFLRLDPVLAGAAALAGRFWLWAFLPAMVVVVSAVLAGRIFCGYFCPMGTTIDAGDHFFAPRFQRQPRFGRWPAVKYLVLVFIIAAAALGFSLVHWAAPLSLITRFYGLLLQPALALAANQALSVAYPLAESLQWDALLFAQISTPHFRTGLFVLVFFVGVFALGRVSPRFWCRHLCPTGALLGLAGAKPLIRRRVSDKCIDCGRCQRECPMGAIPEPEPRLTDFRECVACRTCANVCPVDAVDFGCKSAPARQDDEPTAPLPVNLPTRRGFLTAGVLGGAVAAAGLTNLVSPLGKPAAGLVAPVGLLRPPGALPEPDFLGRCVRCGQCMVACPTNTLQPLWFDAGLQGMFSPALTPRRGPCDPRCRACAQACPTSAMRLVSPKERVWIKTGTAVVDRRTCLAWEHHKPCLACDEVCPYDAIDFRRQTGNPAPVPHVIEEKCAGCGYCEHFCPIQNRPAIFVKPEGQLRLAQGSYEQHGRVLGLNLSLKPKHQPAQTPSGDPPAPGPAPGFTPESETAPGFTPKSETAPGFTPESETAPGFTPE